MDVCTVVERPHVELSAVGTELVMGRIYEGRFINLYTTLADTLAMRFSAAAHVAFVIGEVVKNWLLACHAGL